MSMKKSLFKKWLLTYMALILVALFFIFALFTLYNRSMRDDLKNLNQVYLEQVAGHFDHAFDAMDQLVFSLSLEPRLINVVNMDPNLSVNNRYEIRTLYNSFTLFARANSFVKSVDLYAIKPNVVLAHDSAYFGDLIEVYTQSTYGMPSIQFKNLLEVTHSKQVLRIKDWFPEATATNALLYIQSVPIQFQNNPRGALVVTIDEKALDDYGKKEWLPNSKFLILDEIGKILYTSDSQFYHQENTFFDWVEEASDEVDLQGITYVKSSMISSRGWQYINLVPKDNYFQRVNRIGFITLLVTLLFFAINSIVAYFFANRMYSPVKKIMISFKDDTYEINQSEYDFIENMIQKNKKEQERMKKELILQNQPLKNAFLSKLFRGYIKDPIYIGQQLDNYKMKVSDSGFIVLLVDYTIEKQGIYDVNLSRFIIQNVFQEVLSSYFDSEAVEIEDRAAFIVNIKHEDAWIDLIENQVATGIDMMEKNFGFSCTIGISQVHRLIIGLSNAYQESLEAVKHASMMENCRIIYYDVIQNLNSYYDFSTEDEYKLIHFIKMGDLEQAVLLIESVIDHNRQDHQLKLGYMQCLMFDMVGAIIKSVNDEAFYDMIGKKDPIKRMMQTSHLDEMKAIILEILTMACEINASRVDNHKGDTMVSEIDAYIKEHYSDSNLNVSRLGDVFDMNPAYLSRIYKKETNRAISAAINEVRVNASERLLITTDKGVGEIAEAVGYMYPNAFIRFFKNHTGITPGQYRQLNEK